MQDQEFNKDQNIENQGNQDAAETSPEVETLSNFRIENAELPEQETVVFSQNQETPQTEQFEIPVQADSYDEPGEEELFGKYEIKSWEFSPRIYKIFAISAVVNILFLVGVAQTDILRTKACDSPLVGGFCQVIDTLYVGGKVISPGDEFGSNPYDPTKIDNSEVVWVDKTGLEPPLTYPAGYFQITNPPVDPTLDPLANGGTLNFPTDVTPFPLGSNPTTTTAPPMPAPRNNGIFNRAQKVPKMPKGNVIVGGLPDDIKIPSDNQANNDTKKSVTDDTKKPDEPKQKGLETLPVAEETINKKPLQDFGEVVLDKVAKKEIDLGKEFSVIMVGTITDQGKFDPKKSGFIKTTGDQAMVDVAKLAIESIGDSGLLTYLKRAGVDQIKFELVQNDKEIYAVITSDQKSENEAKTITSTLITALSIGRMTVKEEDTLALLNASKVESKAKTFVLNFNLEKAIAQELIKRQLDKAEAKRKQAEQAKPNSTAQTVTKQDNTAK